MGIFLKRTCSARSKAVLIAKKFIAAMAKNQVRIFKASALHLFCTDKTLSVAAFLMDYFDPRDFLEHMSRETLLRLTDIRTDENYGRGLLVQGHLFNRPVEDGALPDSKVLFLNKVKCPLNE